MNLVNLWPVTIMYLLSLKILILMCSIPGVFMSCCIKTLLWPNYTHRHTFKGNIHNTKNLHDTHFVAWFEWHHYYEIASYKHMHNSEKQYKYNMTLTLVLADTCHGNCHDTDRDRQVCVTLSCHTDRQLLYIVTSHLSPLHGHTVSHGYDHNQQWVLSFINPCVLFDDAGL